MKMNWRFLLTSLIIGMLAMCMACYEPGDGAQPGCNDTSGDNSNSNDNDNSEPSNPSEPDDPAIEPDDPAVEPDDPAVEPGSEMTLPPANASFDYQLGGAYSPPDGVQVVSRDRNDPPAAGLYNICYINGFQVQPDEEGLWPDDLILRDQNGNPVIDSGWDEMLLDITTAEKRQRVADIIGGWIEGCATDGYDAIEIDNLDSYSRSGNRIKMDHAVAFMALLSPIAHEHNMAIAQKNSTELLGFRDQMGTDFAVAEECSRYSECGDYIDVYNENVLMIEYRSRDFDKGCSQYGETHSIILRDLYLQTPGSGSYVYDGC